MDPEAAGLFLERVSQCVGWAGAEERKSRNSRGVDFALKHTGINPQPPIPINWCSLFGGPRNKTEFFL